MLWHRLLLTQRSTVIVFVVTIRPTRWSFLWALVMVKVMLIPQQSLFHPSARIAVLPAEPLYAEGKTNPTAI